MLSSLVAVVLIVAVGSSIGDRIRLRQEELILQRLPESEARAYYEVLRRRVRKTQVLRAIALISLVVISYTYKHRIAHGGGAAATTPPAQAR